MSKDYTSGVDYKPVLWEHVLGRVGVFLSQLQDSLRNTIIPYAQRTFNHCYAIEKHDDNALLKYTPTCRMRQYFRQLFVVHPAKTYPSQDVYMLRAALILEAVLWRADGWFEITPADPCIVS